MTVGQLREQLSEAEWREWQIFLARRAQREQLEQLRARARGSRRTRP